MAIAEEKTVIEAIASVAREVIAPAAETVDRERRFPEAGIRALAEVGALGLLAGTEHGGLDGGLRRLIGACETVGSACASTGMVFLMHLVTSATVRAGGGPVAGELLPALATGRMLGTLAFSERGTGAHFYAPELRARRENGTVWIDGRKSFVTSSGHADVMLVLLQSDGEGLDCYAVPSNAVGVSTEGEWTGLGMRGNSSIAVSFDGVGVTADTARIGAPGTGADLVFGTVAPNFLAGLAAVNVGIAQAALTAAIHHVKARTYADGTTLAAVPAIQEALARLDAETSSARALLRRGAELGDAAAEAALVTLMEAKVVCTQTSAAVARGALEVCGGQGYTTALPIERHVRDSLAGAVMAPTNGVLRTWTGKALAGLPVP